MKTNTELKNTALAALRGHWGKAVLASVIYAAVLYFSMGPAIFSQVRLQNYARENGPQVTSSMSVGTAVREAMQAAMALSQDPAYLDLQSKASGTMGLYYLISIFVVLPLGLGFFNAFRLLLRGDGEVPTNMGRIAFQNYWHKVWGMFLMYIFIALWSLLFLIPGIIKMFSYAMTPYILEENPELTAGEAIDRSRAMMKGHKFDLFWLYLSFIGWFFLGFLTLGIGTLWISPYLETAQAAFYEEVKADYEINGGLV